MTLLAAMKAAGSKAARNEGATGSTKNSNWLDGLAHAETDRADEYLELSKYSRDYVESWAAKCCRSSYQSELKVKESDLLDEIGMKFVGAFMEGAEDAAAKGKMLHPDFLSYLVLIVRNDVVHHHSHVSRRAYQCLLKYLDRYPYAAVLAGSEDHEDQYGQVIVCPEAAWLPIFKERGGFFHKALMSEDMAMAGQEYGLQELGISCNLSSQTGKASSMSSREKWRSVDEMLLHFTNRALDSVENDFNGDLLLFDYLVKVTAQDLECRMCILRSILERKKRDEGDMPVHQMKSLLQNSALWRLLLEMKWNARTMRQMVHGLVELIVDVQVPDDEGVPTQDLDIELEDDAPAGVCAFSKAGLSNLASTFLNSMMDLFGMMERIGGFYATSSHRAGEANFRIALDEYLVDSFWTERGFCGEKEDASTFLFSLRPRDALRFIGFVVADKFTKTYDEGYIKRNYPESVEQVQELYWAMHVIDVGNKDVSKFFEIGMDSILAAIVMDIHRTIRMFKSADHLCLLVGAIGVSLEKLVLDGESIPGGKKDVAVIKNDLKRTIDVIYENEAATNPASRVGNFGSMCLSLAALFVNS